jgi:hypothetical protein
MLKRSQLFFLELISEVRLEHEMFQRHWRKSIPLPNQAQAVGNPPKSIWRYDYKGQTVYYVPEQCCDQGSSLFGANGKLICVPDGGFSGASDGHCSDFFQERKNEKFIWKDSRKR